jgi:hypothetical protein
VPHHRGLLVATDTRSAFVCIARVFPDVLTVGVAVIPGLAGGLDRLLAAPDQEPCQYRSRQQESTGFRRSNQEAANLPSAKIAGVDV